MTPRALFFQAFSNRKSEEPQKVRRVLSVNLGKHTPNTNTHAKYDTSHDTKISSGSYLSLSLFDTFVLTNNSNLKRRAPAIQSPTRPFYTSAVYVRRHVPNLYSLLMIHAARTANDFAHNASLPAAIAATGHVDTRTTSIE
jgi:hypothetical protein